MNDCSTTEDSKRSNTKIRVDSKRCQPLFFTRDPAGIRTQDPYIKSVLLYQLSYQIIPCGTMSTVLGLQK